MKKISMDLTKEEQALILAHRLEEEKRKFQPRSLRSYTVEEKCEFFDKLYEYAINCLTDLRNNGCFDYDSEHSLWEDVISLLVSEGKICDVLWNYWGSLDK